VLNVFFLSLSIPLLPPFHQTFFSFMRAFFSAEGAVLSLSMQTTKPLQNHPPIFPSSLLAPYFLFQKISKKSFLMLLLKVRSFSRRKIVGFDPQFLRSLGPFSIFSPQYITRYSRPIYLLWEELPMYLSPPLLLPSESSKGTSQS